MDHERRGMERNLHDGAQHHLVSLRMTLGLVEHELTCGHLEEARAGLERLTAQIDDTQTVVAETASGVSAAPLREHGLLAVLEAELSGAHPPVTVISPQVLAGRRYPAAAEDAVYFCCLEAVNNARKHAPGTAVEVRIAESDATLHFTVRDEGPGFTPQRDTGEDRPQGRGLRNVNARIAAVGGRITIRSATGAGTTIEGSVPVPGEQSLLDQVRALLREARVLYDGTAHHERLRQLQSQLDGPPPGETWRAGGLKAHSVLHSLDAVLRSSPLRGDRARQLGYQLEQIRAQSHELSEIDLLAGLRSGGLPLPPDQVQVAETLLGVAGTEPWARLGLRAEAGTGEVREAASRQLACWQQRAWHPGSPRAVRDAAEVLIRTCAELLAQIGAERGGAADR